MEIELMDGYEQVNFITDWWDGPKNGIAGLEGKLHYFERIFDQQADDWSEYFLLRPISSQEYELQKEQHVLFLQWLSDSKAGHAPQSHPLFDQENIRYHELVKMISGLDKYYYQHRYTGEFLRIRSREEEQGSLEISDFNLFQVRWTRVEEE